MKEIWKTVDGFSRYEVSSLGRFRKKGFKRVQRGTINDRGYKVVHLTDDEGRQRMMSIIGWLRWHSFPTRRTSHL